jgi:tRNA A-37 threonylcarbamoyl transferase component Bud32
VPQPPSQADQLAPGSVLARRYRIEQLIGSGGYANVYRAIDLDHRRERAIKEVTDADAGVRRQFELEAGLLIHSSHPNIPRGFQLFEERGRLYLVMEFVRGRDLEDLLNESLTQRRRPLDEEQVLRLAIEVCGALVEMHEREVPIIHRDIKPANIKITPEGKPVLIDFGLAKLQTGGPTRTAAQGVSPGFAPPEQYMAKGKTDARTDIYGLGATLYACLTGKDPPEAPSRLLAQTGTTGQMLVAPRQMVKDGSISEATDRIVCKMLELSPASRYQSARDLRDDLDTALRMRTKGADAGRAKVTVMCPRCGEQVHADAARCPHCGGMLRGTAGPASGGRVSAKPMAVQPGTGAKVTAGDARRQPPAAPPKLTPPKPTPAKPPAVIAPQTGKQQKLSAGPRRTPEPGEGQVGQEPTALAPQTGKPVAANGRTGKQVAVAANGRTAKQVAIAERQTGKQVAAANGRTGKQPAAGVAAGEATAVVGALALSPAAVPAIGKQRAPKVVPSEQREVVPQVAPAVQPRRSWLNLRGPELSSLGKAALALSTLETCWGALLIALAIVEIATRDSAQKPYFILAVAWLGVVVLVCALGAQVLDRPVYRRGKITGLRRGLQGFGLTLYSLAVHGIAIWGYFVFDTSRPNASLAIIAFVLFAVNVFVAGLLALINTLG